MFMHIYKMRDGKWHLWSKDTFTDCGKTMKVIVEDRIIGQKGNKYYPDPPVNDVCPKCFHFLPAFNSTGNASS